MANKKNARGALLAKKRGMTPPAKATRRPASAVSKRGTPLKKKGGRATMTTTPRGKAKGKATGRGRPTTAKGKATGKKTPVKGARGKKVCVYLLYCNPIF